MTLAKMLALFSACSFIAACGTNNHLPHPRATMFPSAQQQSLQSASHWQLLAENESVEIARSLGNGGGVISPSIYLGTASNSAGDFQSAYHNMLLSALVDQDVDVMLSRENALFTLDYDVQVVEHDRRALLPPRPGSFSTFLLAGVGIHDAQYWGDSALILIPAALAGDLWSKFNSDMAASVTEVIITTRVLDSQQIVHSSNHVYYFDQDDIAQYKGKGRVFNVVSDRGGQ
ncbi:MAG: hypothetical protein ACSHXZ_14270 [Gammaproteobacteria bacterium]